MSQGTLHLESWAGSSAVPVEVISMTKTKYRIQAITRTKLGGRGRWLEVGQVALVPRHAVRDNCEICDGLKGGVPGNENIVEGVVMCDYCDAARTRGGQ